MEHRFENPEIKSFRDIVAWQKGYAIGLEVYKVTAQFPVEERFALTSQLRRGAVSVASNIAEGYGRGGRADYVRFLKISRGALYELDTQIRFATDLGYLPSTTSESLKSRIDECARILGGLIRSLETGP